MFKQLTSLSISNDVGSGLLREIKRRKALLKLSESAYLVANGSKEIDLQALLSEVDTTVDHQQYAAKSTDLESILESTIQKPGLRWRLNSLNKSLGSLRKGDFGYIFARPETGKTAFLISEASHMLAQLTTPMLHFNNEEEDSKVILRYYMGYFGITLEQVMAQRSMWGARFKEEVGDKLAFFGIEYCNKADMEAICKEYDPSLAVVDQLSKIKGFAADRDDLKLGATFQWARELAKQYCPIIGVHQADGSAEGVKYLTMDHCANAKTAIQAEADWILGIGKTHDIGADEVRYLSICKNKLLGDTDSDEHLRHGRFEVLLRANVMQYRDVVNYD